MPAARDLTGQRFGLLTAISASPNRYRGRVLWTCECDCGVTKEIRVDYLTQDRVSSCGCNRGAKLTIHGDYKAKLYFVWRAMRNRCTDENNPYYNDYGGRGITFAAEWEDYLTFKKWALAAGYEEGLTLDRENNDGNYETSNCRWVSQSVQVRNTRANRYININGVEKTLTDWCSELGLSRNSVSGKLYRGKSLKEAFSLTEGETIYE